MRYTIVVFWALLIGQIVGYIGGALNHQTYDFKVTAVVSLIAGLLVVLLGHVASSSNYNEKKSAAK